MRMRTMFAGLAAAGLLLSASAGIAASPHEGKTPGATEYAPGQQMNEPGAESTSPGASEYAPGQKMNEPGAPSAEPGATEYAPGQMKGAGASNPGPSKPD